MDQIWQFFLDQPDGVVGFVTFVFFFAFIGSICWIGVMSERELWMRKKLEKSLGKGLSVATEGGTVSSPVYTFSPARIVAILPFKSKAILEGNVFIQADKPPDISSLTELNLCLIKGDEYVQLEWSDQPVRLLVDTGPFFLIGGDPIREDSRIKNIEIVVNHVFIRFRDPKPVGQDKTESTKADGEASEELFI